VPKQQRFCSWRRWKPVVGQPKRYPVGTGSPSADIDAKAVLPLVEWNWRSAATQGL